MARLGAVIVAVDINEETNNDTVRVIQQVVLKFKPYIILSCLLYCYNQQEVPNGVALVIRVMFQAGKVSVISVIYKKG